MTLDEFVKTMQEYKEDFDNEQEKFGDIPDNFPLKTWFQIIGRWHKINKDETAELVGDTKKAYNFDILYGKANYPCINIKRDETTEIEKIEKQYEAAHEAIVNLGTSMVLKGVLCSICDLPVSEKGHDVVCSGKNPLTYAHEKCWNESREC